MTEGPLWPGDLIVFHGMVGGQRGTCLVVSVRGSTSSHELWFTYLYLDCNTKLCRSFKTDGSLTYERINERNT